MIRPRTGSKVETKGDVVCLIYLPRGNKGKNKWERFSRCTPAISGVGKKSPKAF